MSYKDIMGQRFGKLVAIGQEGRCKYRCIIWLCLCDCGNLTSVVSFKLRNGNTQSCGCLQKERSREVNISHGKSYSRIYSIWGSMLTRCNNSRHESYFHYGGRGIKVCERWKVFKNFLADMGEPPDGLTLDRKDVNGNYEPGNCRWVTWEVQNNNKRG